MLVVAAGPREAQVVLVVVAPRGIRLEQAPAQLGEELARGAGHGAVGLGAPLVAGVVLVDVEQEASGGGGFDGVLVDDSDDGARGLERGDEGAVLLDGLGVDVLGHGVERGGLDSGVQDHVAQDVQLGQLDEHVARVLGVLLLEGHLAAVEVVEVQVEDARFDFRQAHLSLRGLDPGPVEGHPEEFGGFADHGLVDVTGFGVGVAAHDDADDRAQAALGLH